MHIPALFPLMIMVVLPFAIVWFWPRNWVAGVVTAALLALMAWAYLSIVAPIFDGDPNRDSLIQAGLVENAVKVAVISAIMFGIVAWRRRKKTPA